MSSDSIIPEGFDLDQARRAHSTTPHETQPRCPECGSIKIHEKRRETANRIRKGDYRCGKCAHHFDEPAAPEVRKHE